VGDGKMFSIINHLITPDWWAQRGFGRGMLLHVEAAIARSEMQHRAELRFVAEGGLHPRALLKNTSPRTRALELFAQLNVWDTAENSGVLIYVQLIDRDIEIVADRGISAWVSQNEWDSICARMQAAFRDRRFEAGTLAGIEDVSTLLTRHFPAGDANPNELPDKPVVL
jgi:uncharacterized membrane protein